MPSAEYIMEPTITAEAREDPDLPTYWELILSIGFGPVLIVVTIDEPYLCTYAQWNTLGVPYIRRVENLLKVEVTEGEGRGGEGHVSVILPYELVRPALTAALIDAGSRGLRFAGGRPEV